MTFNAGAKLHASDLAGGTLSEVVGGQYRVTSAATVGTTELAVVTTNAIQLLANSTYEVEFHAKGDTNGATVERWIQRIRDSSVTGTQITVTTIAQASNAGEPLNNSLKYIWVTTTAVSKTFVGTMVRDTSNNGANTLTFSGADTFIKVTLVGSNSVFSTA